jgi:Tol biopolymer transport system component
MERLPAVALVVLAVVMVACGSNGGPSVPAPEAQPAGSLLVLETRPCNWLPPPDRCDAVGLARIGLDGERIEDLTPELPISMRSFALNQARDTIAWTWNWEIAVMPLDGAEPRIVSEKLLPERFGEIVFDPTWSPDGSELLYRWVGVNDEHTWYRLQVDTGELVEVPMAVDCWGMVWRPDGMVVACEVPHRFGEGDQETERADLYVVDLDTLEARALTDPLDAIDDRRPAWSPDGRWLAFSRWTDDPALREDQEGIWILDVAAGEGRRVAAGRLALPTWSPDGGHLAAFDHGSGRIVVVGRDGSDLTTLDHDPRRFVAPRWQTGDS